MRWIGILSLSAPFLCMIALVAVAFAQDLRSPDNHDKSKNRRRRRTGAAYALGAAFLCFSMFYHPRLELAVAAEVQQEEQDESDDQSDTESPVRHLLRQLRRIRQGESVDRLVWRLE